MTTFSRADNAFKIQNGPDAASADFQVSTSGATTISALTATALTATALKLAVASVAAAGTVQSDAVALIPGINVVSGADGTKGARLPVTTGGDIVIVKNNTAGILKIWPATGAAINAVAANSAFSTTATVVPVLLFSTSATQWFTLPLVPT